MTEETLSDKRQECYTGDTIEGCKEFYWHYSEWAVKEFIKKLKEELSNTTRTETTNQIIERLAGEKLK